MDSNYDKAIELIKTNNSFLITSHAHPDGDGIGSTLALGLALEQMGKSVLMYNQDGVPKVLDFLPGAERLVADVDDNARFDVSLMVDCAQPERAGKKFPPKERRGALICIDHHVTGREVGDVECLDIEAASTGEVVYKLLKKLGCKIGPEIAELILCTIIVDTGFFRYTNTSGQTFKLAAELCDQGASSWHISRNMEERNQKEQLDLLSSTLKTLDFVLGGRLAIMILTQQMFKAAAASVEDAENFINFARSVDGVELAVLIREKGPKEFKVSFRTKDYVDAVKLAREFDGGGHEHAAGCTIKGSLGEVKQTVIKMAEKYL